MLDKSEYLITSEQSIPSASLICKLQNLLLIVLELSKTGLSSVSVLLKADSLFSAVKLLNLFTFTFSISKEERA